MDALHEVKRESGRDSTRWALLFFDHLEEFARLAWYLVADDGLVESAIRCTMIQLSCIPFDASIPELAYHQARETIIQQSIAVLHLEDDRGETRVFWMQPTLGELATLPRLALMLKLVLRSPDANVAKLLDVTPSRVQELVQDAITSLSLRMPESVFSGCYDA
jgi:hypothetical protein